MTIYILTGLTVFLCLKNYETQNNDKLYQHKNLIKVIYKCLAVLILTFIFGFRDYSVGTDTINYLNIFKWLGSEFTWKAMFLEKGFSFLSIFVNKFFGNFTVLLLISGFIIYWNIISAFCELSKSPSISVLCYFGLGSFAQSCNLLRQYLALSFCLISLCYLLKKENTFVYFIYLIIAFLFHKSAIIFLVVLPLKYIKFNIKTVIISLLLSIIMIFAFPYLLRTFDSILGTGYSGYLVIKSETFSITNIGTLALIFIVLVLTMKFRRQIKNNTKDIKKYDFFANMFLVFSCIVLISIFSAELIDRLAIYFMPAIFFIVPIVLSSFKLYKSRFYMFLITIAFLMVIFLLLVARGAYEVIPYNFIKLL